MSQRGAWVKSERDGVFRRGRGTGGLLSVKNKISRLRKIKRMVWRPSKLAVSSGDLLCFLPSKAIRGILNQNSLDPKWKDPKDGSQMERSKRWIQKEKIHNGSSRVYIDDGYDNSLVYEVFPLDSRRRMQSSTSRFFVKNCGGRREMQ
ncbi:hypothetical protein CEXT_194361 [Caerostris extrusa]|uniref:Uncharacterized protein n=1 Tax=Caerostris extrusa TaxID=172846 RepID=A0AAV4MM99_CAEEX|nr:hypothetical protein CEXT_194361 [Caerostris extrusa]